MVEEGIQQGQIVRTCNESVIDESEPKFMFEMKAIEG